MPSSAITAQPDKRGIKPEWEGLPRRRCDNCGKRYKPKRPLGANQKYGFCKLECKKQFHAHGSAFIQVRGHITKEIARQFEELETRVREIVRDELNWVICNLPEGAGLADWIRAVKVPRP